MVEESKSKIPRKNIYVDSLIHCDYFYVYQPSGFVSTSSLLPTLKPHIYIVAYFFKHV